MSHHVLSESPVIGEYVSPDKVYPPPLPPLNHRIATKGMIYISQFIDYKAGHNLQTLCTFPSNWFAPVIQS